MGSEQGVSAGQAGSGALELRPALVQAYFLSPGRQLPCAEEAAGFSAEDPLPGTRRQC